MGKKFKRSKKSIKLTISRTYLRIFVLFYILIIITTIGILFLNEYISYYYMLEEKINDIAHHIKEMGVSGLEEYSQKNLNPEWLLYIYKNVREKGEYKKVFEREPFYHYKNLIYANSAEIPYGYSRTTRVIFYKIKGILKGFLYCAKWKWINNEKIYHIILIEPGMKYIAWRKIRDSYLFFVVPAAVCLILGLIMFGVYGTKRIRNLLSPIRDITVMAKDISMNNRNVRFDVETASYELKELVETINKMLDRLHIEYLKQRKFVSDVSHELRTPVAVVDGYANMLKRWGLKDKNVASESIDAIIKETKNMKNLINNLLLLARHDNNTLKFRIEKFNFSTVLNEILKETQMLDGIKHNIKGNIEDELEFTGDRDMMKQAIRIFVDNAVKYTPPAGEIIIEGYKTDNEIIVKISDTGYGISRTNIGNIFKRFYREDTSRNRKIEGYGLGLPIAKIIIKAHKGRIKVLSRVGTGTKVKVALPRL